MRRRSKWLVMILLCVSGFVVRVALREARPLGPVVGPEVPDAPEPSSSPLPLAPSGAVHSRSSPEAKTMSVGHVVRGIVIDARNGSPVAGAHVVAEASAERGEAERSEVTSGAEGRFEFPLPIRRSDDAVRPVTVRVQAEGYRPQADATIAVRDGSPADDLVIRLDPLLRVRGIVLDAAGGAVGDAIVRLCDGTEQDDVRTGQDGRFDRVTTARRVRSVSARHPTRGTAHLVLAEVGVSGPDGVEIPPLILRERGALGGRVTLPNGAAAAGAWVVALRQPEAGPPSATGTEGLDADACRPTSGGRDQVRAGADGVFRFASLEPGRYVLRSPTDASVGATPERSFEVGDENIVLVVAGTALRLAFVDEAGARVPEGDYSFAEVGAPDRTPPLAGAGGFDPAESETTVFLPRPARLVLTATAPSLDSGPISIDLRAGDVTLRTIVLRRGAPRGRIRVEVVDPSGRSVKPFYVSARRIDPAGGTTSDAVAISSAAGPAIENLREGTYLVDVYPGSGVPYGIGPLPSGYAWARATTVVRGAAESVLRVVARPGSELDVTVEAPPEFRGRPVTWSLREVAAGAEPIGGVWSRSDSPIVGSLGVGGARHFAPRLPPGRYALSVEISGRAPASVEFTVDGDAPTSVRVQTQAR